MYDTTSLRKHFLSCFRRKIEENMKTNEKIKRTVKRKRTTATLVNYFARYNEVNLTFI